MYGFTYSFYITACIKYDSREYRIQKIPQAFYQINITGMGVYKIIIYQVFILPYTAQWLKSIPFHDNIVHK